MRHAMRRSRRWEKKTAALGLVMFGVLAIGLFAGHAGWYGPRGQRGPSPYGGPVPQPAAYCPGQGPQEHAPAYGYPCPSSPAYPDPYQQPYDPCTCQQPVPYLPAYPYPPAAHEHPDASQKPTKASTHGGNKPPKGDRDSRHTQDSRHTRDTKYTRDTRGTRGSKDTGHPPYGGY